MAGKIIRCIGWILGATGAVLTVIGLAGPAQAASTDFVSTWNPANTSPGSSASGQVKLPLEASGVYNFTVGWGDGTSDTITSWNQAEVTHTYSAPVLSSYTITISGTLKGWRFGNVGDRLKILNISQWGNVNFGNNGGYFQGAANLTSNATDAPDLTGTTSLSSAFWGAGLLNGGLAKWNTSQVTDMSNMFVDATSFNQDIGAWDTSNVTSLFQMFSNASAFNQDIGEWNTSQVTDMAFTFFNASAFNQDIGEWNTSQVTDMTLMFFGAASFDQNLAAWDVADVTNMGDMFADSGLSTDNYDRALIGWAGQASLQANVLLGAGTIKYSCAAKNARQSLITTHNWSIVDGGEAPGGCFESSWFTGDSGVSANTQVQLPLESDGTYDFVVDWGDGSASIITAWDAPAARHTYPQTDTYTIKISGTLKGWRFNGAGDVFKIRSISRWGDVNFGNNGGYFKNAVNLTSSATDAPDLTGTTNLSEAFAGAQAFNGDVSGWDTSAVTNMAGMFSGASAFNQDIGDWDTSNVTDMSSMLGSTDVFNQDIGGWDTSKVENMSSMFFNSLKFDADISGWDVGSVTSMSNMFAGAAAFSQDIGGWDVSGVQDMSGMLSGADAFNSDIGGWDTSAVTDMSAMFFFAPLFNQDIGAWDTSNVTNMASMFLSAGAFNQDIGNWNTGAVTNMQQMFAFGSFNRDIGGWDTSSVQNMQGMFWGASNFNQDIGGWDVSSVTNMDALLSGSGISTVNYDQALIGWAGLPAVQANVPLGAQGIRYSCAAEAARQSLIDDEGWTVTDAGLGPCVTITPDPVLFADTTVGQSSAATVTVSNPGGTDLVLPADAVSVTGPDAGPFSIGADNCSSATVPAAGSCTVEVLFAPASAGGKAANLQLESNAISSPNLVLVTGTGLLPGFDASPGALEFGNVTVGKASDPQTVTVTNGGPGTLNVAAGGVQITGAVFTITADTCTGATLKPTGSCAVSVRFSPTAAGAANGSLTFIANDPGSPHVIALSGAGTTPTPAAKKKQTLKVKLPKRIKLSGLTVITPANARTNAGQRVRTIVRGGPIKSTAAGEVRYFTVVRGPDGKVSVRTYGNPNLRLRVTQKAPAVPGYTDFRRQASYLGGVRR